MEDDLNFLTRMEDNLIFLPKWKSPQCFTKMEDDLNFFENGRQPQCIWK